MQIYKAQYIYPISSPPITDGIIAIDGEHIAAVGDVTTIMAQYPGVPVIDLGAAMLLPQAVNAHTHLELTALAEMGQQHIPERSFVQWIQELVRLWRNIPIDRQIEGARDGCRMLIESGTAVVGDISNTHASLEPLLESGLYGILYHEVLSPDPADAPRLLAQAQEQIRHWRSEYGEQRIRFGVTLHTPITVSAELFRAIIPWAMEEQVPLCIHAAESPAETEYLMFGTGEICDIYTATDVPFAEWIPSPGISPIAYLDALGVLAAQPLLAHGVYVDRDDLRLVAQYHVPTAHCPRSNFLLNCGRMPIELYAEMGALLAMGTDSLSSSPSLSVWEEAVSAMRMHTAAGVELNPHTLLQYCTLDGARALGFEKEFGSLESGKMARLAIGTMRDEGSIYRAPTADEMLHMLWEGKITVQGTTMHPLALLSLQ